MTAAAAWRGVFLDRLKATGNVTLAATGAGVTRQNAYRTRNRNKTFRRLRVVPFARRCQAALEAYLAVRGRTPGPLVWAVTGPGQLRPGVRLQPDGLKQLLRRQRGFEVTHETVRAWECRFAPLVSEQLRAKRRGRAGVSWYLDETYVKVGGRWCYLYRAIDHRDDLIDSMLSERGDKHAARRFLRRLVEVAEGKPARITTDLHPAYRRAIRWIIGRKAWHRTTQYLNNYTEQSHRGVKQRYYPMLGFGSFQSAWHRTTQYLNNYGRPST